MGTVGLIIMLALMAATAVVLVIGIGLMAVGGPANRKYGNKMMVLRVVFQGLALAMLAAILLLGR